MPRDPQRIADIIEAAGRIAEYLRSRNQADFLGNRLLQDAVLRQLMIVGEAAINLSAEFKAKHPEIEWRRIAGFRHRIVHDYLGFDLDTAWRIATVALPELSEQLTRILKAEFD